MEDRSAQLSDQAVRLAMSRPTTVTASWGSGGAPTIAAVYNPNDNASKFLGRAVAARRLGVFYTTTPAVKHRNTVMEDDSM
jgi:hypothetical protein